MKLKIALAFLLIVLSVNGIAQHTLSAQAEISVITCAPGDDLYSTFGHTAVRVKDATHRLDIVFNYGTFDFNTSNFYLKFIRGKLNYMLSTSTFKAFTAEYYYTKRAMREQILNLSDAEKQEIFDFLENNAKPENKNYHYDFFYDNCSTRIRDVLQKALRKKLILGENKFQNEETFRDMISLYLTNLRWSELGINIALGLPCDKKVNANTSAFLPDYLFLMLDKSVINKQGKGIPLVKKTVVIYDPKVAKTAPTFNLFSPEVLFWTLFLATVALTFFEWKRKKWYRIFDNALFFGIGFFGIVVLLLWIATDHRATVNNWNLLWLIPTHPLAIFFAGTIKYAKIIWYYFLTTAGLAFVALVFSFVIPQTYDVAFFPLMLTIGVRSVAIALKK